MDKSTEMADLVETIDRRLNTHRDCLLDVVESLNDLCDAWRVQEERVVVCEVAIKTLLRTLESKGILNLQDDFRRCACGDCDTPEVIN